MNSGHRQNGGMAPRRFRRLQLIANIGEVVIPLSHSPFWGMDSKSDSSDYGTEHQPLLPACRRFASVSSNRRPQKARALISIPCPFLHSSPTRSSHRSRAGQGMALLPSSHSRPRGANMERCGTR